MRASRQLDLGKGFQRAPATFADYDTAVEAAKLYRMYSMREVTAALGVGVGAIRNAWKRYGIIPQKGQKSYQRFRLVGYRGLVLALVLSALLERDFTWLRSDACDELCRLANMPSGREFMRGVGKRWVREFRKNGRLDDIYGLVTDTGGEAEAAEALEGSTRRKRRTRRHDVASSADGG